MKRFAFLLTLMVLVAAFSFAAVMAPANSYPPVRIWKYPYCADPTNDVNNEWFSDNPPYNETGVKYRWWITIKVNATMNLDHVEVFDRLGGEFMIDGICLDEPKYPWDDPLGRMPAPYDYTFDYGTGPERDGEVSILNSTDDQVALGYVNQTGVSFNGTFLSDDEDTFEVFWTGNSCKAHFRWIIGPMLEDEQKKIYLVVSTDVNPGGQQEFTSTGTHYLNSGATVKAFRWHERKSKWVPFYSATTAPIPIEVVES